MSPTVFREKGYRFFFFSREEDRMHVHVYCANGEAKFWLESEIALADSHRISQQQLSEMQRIIEERENEITDAWNKHLRR